MMRLDIQWVTAAMITVVPVQRSKRLIQAGADKIPAKYRAQPI
jgi:hypothetical protein